MNELIIEAINEWSDFYDVFDITLWTKFVYRHAYGMILILKSKKEQLGSILHYYQDKYTDNKLIRFGNYIAVLGYEDYVMQYFRDLHILEKDYGTKLKDHDCLLVFLKSNTQICNAEDVLHYGRWILLDKQVEYISEDIITSDPCELEYLLSDLVESNYFGFENFKYVIGLIESAKKYEYLSLVYGAGLKGCPTAIWYALSYLKYLRYQRDYFDPNLLKMLIRFCMNERIIELSKLKENIENYFPGERIFVTVEETFYYELYPPRSYWEEG